MNDTTPICPPLCSESLIQGIPTIHDVCMYVRMHACMHHIYVHTHTCVIMYVCACLEMPVYIHAYISMYLCIYTHTLSGYLCSCFIYIYICMHVHVASVYSVPGHIRNRSADLAAHSPPCRHTSKTSSSLGFLGQSRRGMWFEV